MWPITVLTVIYSVAVTLISVILQSPIYAAPTPTDLNQWGFRHGNEHFRLVWKDSSHLSVVRSQDGKELAECVKIQMVKDSSQIQEVVDLECRSTSIAAFKTLATYTPPTLTDPTPEIRFGNWIGGYHGFGLSRVTDVETYAAH
ncbi:MAG: hypothetical protein JNL01_01845 [Bdellovibrionales bacterium]|nr:hypothetical protein [Bdellovibrionales bacterium]